eukprot:211835-Prymnesium_polylepis.2
MRIIEEADRHAIVLCNHSEPAAAGCTTGTTRRHDAAVGVVDPGEGVRNQLRIECLLLVAVVLIAAALLEEHRPQEAHCARAQECNTSVGHGTQGEGDPRWAATLWFGADDDVLPIPQQLIEARAPAHERRRVEQQHWHRFISHELRVARSNLIHLDRLDHRVLQRRVQPRQLRGALLRLESRLHLGDNGCIIARRDVECLEHACAFACGEPLAMLCAPLKLRTNVSAHRLCRMNFQHSRPSRLIIDHALTLLHPGQCEVIDSGCQRVGEALSAGAARGSYARGVVVDRPGEEALADDEGRIIETVYLDRGCVLQSAVRKASDVRVGSLVRRSQKTMTRLRVFEWAHACAHCICATKLTSTWMNGVFANVRILAANRGAEALVVDVDIALLARVTTQTFIHSDYACSPVRRKFGKISYIVILPVRRMDGATSGQADTCPLTSVW